MPDLGRKVISRDGVQDRRARDAFRLSEENFVALFNEAKRDKSWVTDRASLSSVANNATSTSQTTRSSLFSIVAQCKTTRVQVGLFPAVDYLEFQGATGPLSLPVSSLLTIGSVVVGSTIGISCLRDGQVIGTDTFTVTAGQTLYLPVGSIRFLDRAANGAAHTYQLQIQHTNLPGVGGISTVTLNNAVWEAREVP